MAVITISRQYGSGGDEIARRVCDMLGYQYFDKTLMAKVAAELGLSEEEVVDYSETEYKRRGFFQHLFGSRVVTEVSTWASDARGVKSLRVETLDEARCINLVRDTVLAAYERGNVVIVGRGGQAILREKHGVLHVRIDAPLGARVLAVQRQQALALEAANTLTVNRDQAAAAYLRNFYAIDWDDPALYHLIINTGKWAVESVAHLLISALGHLK